MDQCWHSASLLGRACEGGAWVAFARLPMPRTEGSARVKLYFNNTFQRDVCNIGVFLLHRLVSWSRKVPSSSTPQIPHGLCGSFLQAKP